MPALTSDEFPQKPYPSESGAIAVTSTSRLMRNIGAGGTGWRREGIVVGSYRVVLQKQTHDRPGDKAIKYTIQVGIHIYDTTSVHDYQEVNQIQTTWV